jgi:hypothetical protein
MSYAELSRTVSDRHTDRGWGDCLECRRKSACRSPAPPTCRLSPALQAMPPPLGEAAASPPSAEYRMIHVGGHAVPGPREQNGFRTAAMAPPPPTPGTERSTTFPIAGIRPVPHQGGSRAWSTCSSPVHHLFASCPDWSPTAAQSPCPTPVGRQTASTITRRGAAGTGAAPSLILAGKQRGLRQGCPSRKCIPSE